jgi:hypothetical protein
MGLGNSLQTAQGGAGGIGGWVELGRTTLGSSGDNITVSSLDDKRYYMILHHSTTTGGNSTPAIRLNSDTGSNYSTRNSSNGGADSTVTSDTHAGTAVTSTGSNNLFALSYISNLSSKEKLIQTWGTNFNSSGASNVPPRRERVSKWANTSDVINTITHYNPDTGDFATGSELVVLGWDPADTHTSNFWEELASVELGSASDTLSSGTITAKKYLWVQTYVKATGGTVEPDSRFNSDNSGINNVSGTYADRYSVNGGSDATGTSLNKGVRGSGVPVSAFFNDFIINNASNEKLVIRHLNYVSTAGAATAPSRRETVGKWANTSDQITDITWHDESGSGAQMDTGSIIKVWGSD